MTPEKKDDKPTTEVPMDFVTGPSKPDFNTAPINEIQDWVEKKLGFLPEETRERIIEEIEEARQEK